MMYLLDTCVVSELVKRKPSDAVVAWLSSIPVADLFLSAIVIVAPRKPRRSEKWSESNNGKEKSQTLYGDPVCGIDSSGVIRRRSLLRNSLRNPLRSRRPLRRAGPSADKS